MFFKRFFLSFVLVFIFSIDTYAEIINICDRTPRIRRKIQKAITELRGETGLPEQVDCTAVQREELEKIHTILAEGHKGRQITELTEGDFRYLTGLKYLDLGENQIKELPERFFDDLKSLEVLNLSNNELNKVGIAFDALVSLKHLFLYGNHIGDALDADSFARLEKLERIVLSYNGITKLPNKLFAKNPELKTVVLSYNTLESLPTDLFSKKTALHILDLRMNHFKASVIRGLAKRNMIPKKTDLLWNLKWSSQAERNKLYDAFDSKGSLVLIYEDLKEPERSETVLSNSELVRGMGERIQDMTIQYWKLPFRVTGSFSSKTFHVYQDELVRAIEEKVAIRVLDEVKDAYRTTPFDFYGAEIRFVNGWQRDTKSVDIASTSRSVDVVIEIPTRRSRVATRDSFDDPWIHSKHLVTTGDVLDRLSEKFTWKRKARWYRHVHRLYVRKALHRDLAKIEKLQASSDVELFLLRALVDEITSRSLETGEKITLTGTELEYARFIQFRLMFSLHRLLNTIGRWRPAFLDSSFEYGDEVTVLLKAASRVFRAYLNGFLVSVSGRTSVQHRNPLFKSLNKKMEDSLFVVGGRRSISFPRGSLLELLELRGDKKLYQFFDSIRADRRSVRNAYTKPALRALERANEHLGQERYQLSHKTARLLVRESKIKDTLMGGFYRFVRFVGTILGDTRIMNPDSAVSQVHIEELKNMLRPGDIILVRQDFYASNIFLPGFWPHAILYLGSAEEWKEYRLGKYANFTDKEFTKLDFLPNTPLKDISSLRDKIQRYQEGYVKNRYRVIEAVSEGVLFSSLEKAVKKDYVVVFRPLFESEEQREHAVARAIYSALRFEGKLYDFEFDFTTDDRIVCTELVYRAWDWYIKFSAQKNAPADEKPNPRIPGMKTTAGRDTMPAQEVVRLVLYMSQNPEPINLNNGAILYPGKKLKLIHLLAKPDEGRRAVALNEHEAHQWLRESLNR